MLMVDFALARTRGSRLDEMQVKKTQAIEFLNEVAVEGLRVGFA
jgi:hypothetical protein